MEELEKLETYLKKHGFIYERIDRPAGKWPAKHQIITYKKDGSGERMWDAICLPDGLLEIFGTIVTAEDNDIFVRCLTAEDVIQRLEKCWYV